MDGSESRRTPGEKHPSRSVPSLPESFVWAKETWIYQLIEYTVKMSELWTVTLCLELWKYRVAFASRCVDVLFCTDFWAAAVQASGVQLFWRVYSQTVGSKDFDTPASPAVFGSKSRQWNSINSVDTNERSVRLSYISAIEQYFLSQHFSIS